MLAASEYSITEASAEEEDLDWSSVRLVEAVAALLDT
jgi:acyl carrier protein